MRGRLSSLILLGLVLALGACGSSADGPLSVAIIGDENSVYAGGLRLSEGAQVVRSATGAGLVALDAQGEIEPALADRWIITDGGKSYIFRLREGTWPDGADLTGESARDALRRAVRELRGTSLGLDLAPVDDVRAMAGRVIEIRLKTGMPDFLRLLAQPELSLAHRGFQAGPMRMDRGAKGAEQGRNGAELVFRPPEMRGLPQEEGWRDHVRPVQLHALTAKIALEAFDQGEVDVVLGGTLAYWPLADPGPLSRGNLQIDPAIGLFGLQVVRAGGFLARAENREALALALDRTALVSQFNIGGWLPTDRIVPLAIAGGGGPERWDGVSLNQRRAAAASRVAAWRAGPGKGKAPALTIALANEPGFVLLFNGLADQFGQIGITLSRVDPGKPADLALVDRVARYGAPRWFLDQFNCSLGRGLCDSEADAEVSSSLTAASPQERTNAIARAEALLTAANVYIPIGAPLRWSMVRSSVAGYTANRWAFHPLPDMATIPR